jgi:hypothetical protein
MSTAAGKAAAAVGKAASKAASKGPEGGGALNKGAKRDPELYVCFGPSNYRFMLTN